MKILFNPKYEKAEEERLRFFAEHSQGRVLDIGCAQYPNSYLRSNPRIKHTTGLDIQKFNDSSYDVCKNMKPDAKEFPFKDHSFDTILAGEVIEHVRDPIAFALECNRVLKKGGVLILSTPNNLFFPEYLRKNLGVRSKEDEEHLILFDTFSLNQILSRAGFDTQRKSGYKFWIPLIKLFVTSPRLPVFMSYQMIFVSKKRKEMKKFKIVSNDKEMNKVEIN